MLMNTNASLITLSNRIPDSDVTAFIAALENKEGPYFPKTVVFDDPVSHYQVYCGNVEKGSRHWYLDFTSIALKEGKIDAREVLRVYNDLALKGGDLLYAGDTSHFILDIARRITNGPRFYRQDGITVYGIVREFCHRMEDLNHHLVEIGPVNNPNHTYVIKVVSKTNRD